VEVLANPRIIELRTAERQQAARRRQKVQKTAAIIAACTVAFVGVGFGSLLVHAHFSDQLQASNVKIVKVKTVPIVAEADAAEAVAAAKADSAPTVARTSAAAPSADETAARLGDDEAAKPTPADVGLARKAAQEDIDNLAATDPRWAREAGGAAIVSETSGAAGALTALAPVDRVKPVESAIEEEESERVQTAAIAPDEVKPKPVEEKKPAKADATSDAAPKRMAAVTADVRLRAARNDSSAVLGVVPKGTEIGVVSCDGWCEVVFAGKRGFVYKNFVSGSKLTIVRKEEDAEAANPSPSGTQPTIGRSPANRTPAEVGP
jgi:hypothetical protein